MFSEKVSSDDSLNALGKKIRKARRKKGITIEVLAMESGLSKGFISQIERGRSQPSLSSLKRIAPPLGHSVATLISDAQSVNLTEYIYAMNDDNNQKTQSYSLYQHDHGFALNKQPLARVIKKDNRKQLRLPGRDLYYEILSPLFDCRAEILLVNAEVGDNTGDDFICDQSERIGFVMNGSIEVLVKNEKYIIEECDTIHLQAYVPFKWVAIAGDVIKVLWVLVPPAF